MSAPHIRDMTYVGMNHVREHAGSRAKLKELKQFQIFVGAELFTIKLVAVPANLGSGHYKLIEAPCCGRPCRIIRWYRGWRCPRCLQNMGRRYRSSDYRYKPNMEEQSHV